MDISIGKLAVCTATAGIDPDRVIPVVLDGGLCRLVGSSRRPVAGAAFERAAPGFPA